VHVFDKHEHSAHSEERCEHEPLERAVKVHIETHRYVVFKMQPLFVGHFDKNRRKLAARGAWHLLQILSGLVVLLQKEIEISAYGNADSVPMCVCVCVRVYVYSYLYMYIYIYVYICVCVYKNVYRYICVCIYTYIYVCVCIYTYIYVCVYKYI